MDNYLIECGKCHGPQFNVSIDSEEIGSLVEHHSSKIKEEECYESSQQGKCPHCGRDYTKIFRWYSNDVYEYGETD